ncbi:MAG TPA: alpha-L-fucosidase, partial [Draconibacterium sp.]|nr:alpha-L-fucosidase [Draconibacterium sp.]
MNKIKILFILIWAVSITSWSQVNPVLPTKAQLEWANAEIGVLIHFDMQVFKPDYEWRRDLGKHPDASVFNPKQLDTDQWIKAAKAAGAKYAVLVAKHCSG